MKKKITIKNATGNPMDTEVIVEGKKLPLSHLMSVDISINPSNEIVARVSLIVDNLEILDSVVLDKKS